MDVKCTQWEYGHYNEYNVRKPSSPLLSLMLMNIVGNQPDSDYKYWDFDNDADTPRSCLVGMSACDENASECSDNCPLVT